MSQARGMHARLVGLVLFLCSSLAFAEGRLRIEADVRAAEVLIDGTLAGKTPLVVKLSAGNHRIELRKSDHKPTTAEIEIVDGKLVTLKLALQAIGKGKPTPTKPPPVTTGTIEIRCNVASQVTIDNRLVGTTPVMVSVALGKHVVELEAAGYRSVRQVIDAKPGPLAIEIELQKE